MREHVSFVLSTAWPNWRRDAHADQAIGCESVLRACVSGHEMGLDRELSWVTCYKPVFQATASLHAQEIVLDFASGNSLLTAEDLGVGRQARRVGRRPRCVSRPTPGDQPKQTTDEGQPSDTRKTRRLSLSSGSQQRQQPFVPADEQALRSTTRFGEEPTIFTQKERRQTDTCTRCHGLKREMLHPVKNLPWRNNRPSRR